MHELACQEPNVSFNMAGLKYKTIKACSMQASQCVPVRLPTLESCSQVLGATPSTSPRTAFRPLQDITVCRGSYMHEGHLMIECKTCNAFNAQHAGQRLAPFRPPLAWKTFPSS